MKFTLEFELHGDQISDPNLLSEIIQKKLVQHIVYLCQIDASNSESKYSEIWIDASDDGDEEYNVYSIRSIKNKKKT